MPLIHEELYNGEDTDTFDFSAYLQKLATDLFQTYSLNSKIIRLVMIWEKTSININISIPLGIIVNNLSQIPINTHFVGEIAEKSESNSIRKKSGTLGMQLITALVEQLNGELELNRKNGTKLTLGSQ